MSLLEVGRHAAPAAKANNFDVIRWTLASSVILSHSYPLALGAGTPDPLGVITQNQMYIGRLAVGFFFCISGYLIAQSRERSSLGRFFWKRFLRIGPAFALSFLLGLVLFGYLGADHRETYFADIYKQGIWAQARNLALLMNPATPAVFGGTPFSNALNGSVWTIQWEEGCYLGVGLLWVLGYRNRWAVLTGFVASWCWYAWAHYSHSPSELTGPRLITWYLAGSTLYHFRRQVAYTWRQFASAILVLVIASLAGALAVALPIFGTYAIFFLAFRPSAWFRDFKARFGDLSYGTYLYAWPVQQLVVMNAPQLPPLAVFAIALPLTTFFAAISWFSLERYGEALKGWTPGLVSGVRRGVIGAALER